MARKSGRKIVTLDWAIKTVLRDKADFDVLEGFLTALLGRPITLPVYVGGGKQSP